MQLQVSPSKYRAFHGSRCRGSLHLCRAFEPSISLYFRDCITHIGLYIRKVCTCYNLGIGGSSLRSYGFVLDHWLDNTWSLSIYVGTGSMVSLQLTNSPLFLIMLNPRYSFLFHHYFTEELKMYKLATLPCKKDLWVMYFGFKSTPPLPKTLTLSCLRSTMIQAIFLLSSKFQIFIILIINIFYFLVYFTA